MTCGAISGRRPRMSVSSAASSSAAVGTLDTCDVIVLNAIDCKILHYEVLAYGRAAYVIDSQADSAPRQRERVQRPRAESVDHLVGTQLHRVWLQRTSGRMAAVSQGDEGRPSAVRVWSVCCSRDRHLRGSDSRKGPADRGVGWHHTAGQPGQSRAAALRCRHGLALRTVRDQGVSKAFRFVSRRNWHARSATSPVGSVLRTSRSTNRIIPTNPSCGLAPTDSSLNP